MKKSKVSSKVAEQSTLSDAIFTENQDDLFLFSVVARETSAKNVDVLDELNNLFAISEVVSESSSKSAIQIDKTSIFASVKSRDDELTNTFLLDTVIAMTIKLSLKYKQDLTCQAVSNYLINQDCYDKWDSKTANVAVKLTARVKDHIRANNERKRSVLYNSVTTRKRKVYVNNDASKCYTVDDIIITDRVKTLVCESSLLY